MASERYKGSRFRLERGSAELFTPQYNEKHNYVITATKDLKVTAFVGAGKNGWTISVKGKKGDGDFQNGGKTMPRRYTIPYQVPEERLLPAITDMIGAPKYKDKKEIVKDGGKGWFKEALREPLNQLIDSVPLEKRKKEFTVPGIVDRLPMKLLAYGRKSSDKAWFTDVLTHEFNLKEDTSGGYDALPEQHQDKIFALVAKGKIRPEEVNKTASGMMAMRGWHDTRKLVKEAQNLNLLPSQYHSVRKYHKIEPDQYMNLLKTGIMASPKWGKYIGHVHETFGKTLLKHSREITAWKPFDKERAELRDKFVDLLEHWPKNEKQNKLLDSLFNAGIPVEAIVTFNIKTEQETQRIIQIARRYQTIRSGFNNPKLNSNYKPPDIELPKGWKWADHKDFGMLSDTYRCCISNHGFYERGIVNGTAHAMYRPELTETPNEEKDQHAGRGALAYIKWNRDRWEVEENRAWANETPKKQYQQEAEIIVRGMTITKPGPHPVVEQETIKTLQIDPLLQKYAEIKERDERRGGYGPFDISYLVEMELVQREKNNTGHMLGNIVDVNTNNEVEKNEEMAIVR